MSDPLLSWVTILIILVASSRVLLSRTWREGIIALAVQYLGVFILTTYSWPVALAAVKLVVGCMSCAVLGASLISGEDQEASRDQSSGGLFQLAAAGLVWLIVYTISSQAGKYFPIRLEVLQGGFLLIGMGILQLGMHRDPMRVSWGLLTTLSGFEVIYAPLETSVLVAGLLVVINLGLALTGAYMLTFSAEEEFEEGL